LKSSEKNNLRGRVNLEALRPGLENAGIIRKDLEQEMGLSKDISEELGSWQKDIKVSIVKKFNHS